MKIFDWVQRKLHQNVIKDGMAKSVKKTESAAIDNNTLALLEQVALVDILTIGTFGFDPLKPSQEFEDDYENDDVYGVRDTQIKGNEDENGDDETEECFQNHEEEEEVNHPLMFTRFGQNLDRVIAAVDLADQGVKEEVDDEGKKKRRTLAELFLEDPDINFKKTPSPFKIELNYGKKLFGSRKNDVVFGRKITPMVKDSSHHESLLPIKSKLRHMMKRMLKRKIHPDVDGDKINHSDVSPNKPIKTNEDSESASLLLVPDHVA